MKLKERKESRRNIKCYYHVGASRTQPSVAETTHWRDTLGATFISRHPPFLMLFPSHAPQQWWNVFLIFQFSELPASLPLSSGTFCHQEVLVSRLCARSSLSRTKPSSKAAVWFFLGGGGGGRFRFPLASCWRIITRTSTHLHNYVA